ncbi:MAG TPA: GNAT family N-acetyltransferase [Candidatus Saccharimonadales bacterium]
MKPDVARDAPLGVRWLAGGNGRDTLRKMGVTDQDNKPTTLGQEQRRVRDFLENKNQVCWMIQAGGKIVGAVWVNLEPNEYLRAPSVHIMIGDPAARGKGIGVQVFRSVVTWLENDQKYSKIYTRHLVSNVASAKLAGKSGFVNSGETYRDSDGLLWQNMLLDGG